MVILDMPYVSDFLKNTLSEFRIPVIDTGQLNQFKLNKDTVILPELNAIETLKKKPGTRIYTNSENAIGWIGKNLSFSELPAKINIFKDKLLFRKLTQTLYPDLFFKGLDLKSINSLDITEIPLPFIIKPSVGFFSMAVYRVNSADEWPGVKENILNELKQVEGIYPVEVMDTGKFIIEGIIEGEEYAVDAYFDKNGKPVVLNIMKHIFASESDFSDRLYITSADIIGAQLGIVENFLAKIGEITNLKDFPLHIELRVKEGQNPIPIEVNPLRFGAWCTTADTTFMAYNFNSIHYFLNELKPDWNKILSSKEGKIYAMMVLENSTGYKTGEIKSFNYDKLVSQLEKPLEIRKIDFYRYPVFGFLFAETRTENFAELERILCSDLREFVELL
ncbi:MAG: ATP-grasp domain-containing protein [Bacteroidales bacterium]